MLVYIAQSAVLKVVVEIARAFVRIFILFDSLKRLGVILTGVTMLYVRRDRGTLFG